MHGSVWFSASFEGRGGSTRATTPVRKKEFITLLSSVLELASLDGFPLDFFFFIVSPLYCDVLHSFFLHRIVDNVIGSENDL